MNSTESENLCNDFAYQYGECHGTAFFYNGEDHSSFVDYMETQLKDRFENYFRGFLNGLDGNQRRKYRCFKLPEKNEMEALNNETKTPDP